VVDIIDLVRAHIERFNAAVAVNNFDEMVAHFTEDATMSFEGVPVGPFRGREAIAAAYAAQPPDDQLLLLEVLDQNADSIDVSYAWAADPARRAGTMTIERGDGLISRLVVRFE
jgi:steroid delta-isomerase